VNAPVLYAFRHPKPVGAEGRCIGAGTDLPVDPRRAKRLAHRVRRLARREGLAHVVATSPLQRCAVVGRWLKRWGWQHRIDAELLELDFGTWDGRAWSTIARGEVDAWCADFERHAPGGGEPLARLLDRARAWQPQGASVIVTHGGWLLARRWVSEHTEGRVPRIDEWPPAPRYGEQVAFAGRT
jgi:alpha-ribazole phosphatase